MTGEQFVKLCLEEAKTTLKEYFDPNTQSEVGQKIQKLVKNGVCREELKELLNLVLSENYYTLLLALDGEASLGGEQMSYRLYDENGNCLNSCGEIEEAAFKYFMEE